MTRYLKINVFFLFPLLCMTACHSQNDQLPKEIIRALDIAGDNKDNLLSVINNYRSPADSLKLKAAYYLIRNMEGQYHYSGQAVNEFNIFIAVTDSLTQARKDVFKRMNDSAFRVDPLYDTLELIKMYKRKVLDSMQKKHGEWRTSNVTKIADLTSIKSDILIENIDMAFIAWQYPWCKKLSFEQFCEYLLPYKALNETPVQCRAWLNRKLQWVIPKMGGSTDPKKACILINDYLRTQFIIEGTYFKYPLDLNFNQLNKLRMGKCADANHFAAYAMRAMGVPVISDYTPYWANKNKGHDWLVLLYKYNNQSFIGSESNPGTDKVDYTGRRELKRTRAKVFRRTYAKQKALFDFATEMDYVPPLFSDPHQIDVTDLYIPVSTIQIEPGMMTHLKETNFGYLCVFNNNKWTPIACSKIDKKGLIFNKMGRDILYLAVSYNLGEMRPVTKPMILGSNGALRYLDTGKTEIFKKITLFKKYPQDKTNLIVPGEHYQLFYWNNRWISLGTQKATSDSLIFANTPQNVLFILRDIDKGEQERIFTIENGKQVWW